MCAGTSMGVRIEGDLSGPYITGGGRTGVGFVYRPVLPHKNAVKCFAREGTASPRMKGTRSEKGTSASRKQTSVKDVLDLLFFPCVCVCV